jgi:hypothetical protein
MKFVRNVVRESFTVFIGPLMTPRPNDCDPAPCLITDEVVNAAHSTLLIGPRKGCQIAVKKPCRLSLKVASRAQANAKLNP